MKQINEDTLIEYVLGVSGEAEQRMIETEMEISSELRKRVATLNDTLALSALSVEPFEPGKNLFSKIEKTILQGNPFEGFVDRLTVFLDLTEQKVRELLATINTAEKEWKTTGVQGVLMKEFSGGPRHAESECSLIWMKPNAIFPKHGHLADEWGFILQGEAEEDDGKASKPGDIVLKTDQDEHTVIAIGDEPLVFFTIHKGINFI